MTGCIAQRKDVYYVRLTYYDKTHKRKDKWVSTGLSGRGAKQKAIAMINSFIEKYSYLERVSILPKWQITLRCGRSYS